MKSWNDLAEIENAVAASDSNNLLLIDSHNLAYRWLHRKNYNNFEEDYNKTVESLSKSYGAKNTIVCFDFGKSYYRINLLDSYKGTRKKPEEEEEQRRYEEFFACLNGLPEYLDFLSLKFRGIEADDLITFLVTNLSDRYDHIWIVTSDRDMYQLISDKVSIFNIFSRKEVTLESFVETYQMTPEQYLFSRMLEGDKSDNILGIEGIGPKRAQQIVKDYETLEKLVSSLPLKGKAKYIQNLNSSKDTLLRNEKLISLKKYNKTIIESGKDGKEVWEGLVELVSEVA